MMFISFRKLRTNKEIALYRYKTTTLKYISQSVSQMNFYCIRVALWLQQLVCKRLYHIKKLFIIPYTYIHYQHSCHKWQYNAILFTTCYAISIHADYTTKFSLYRNLYIDVFPCIGRWHT